MKLYYNEKYKEITINLIKENINGKVKEAFSITRYPLGQLLIDFVELDFWDIETNLEEHLLLSIPKNNIEVSENIKKIENIFINLINEHPYFITIIDVYNELILDYKSTTDVFLKKVNSEDNKTQNDLDVFFYPILHHVNGLGNMSNHYSQAIDFVLNADFSKNFKNLSYLQRYYLFTYINRKLEEFDVGILDIPMTYTNIINTEYDIDNKDLHYREKDPNSYKLDLDEMISFLPKEPLNLYQIYDVHWDTICNFEFQKLITNDTIIRRCSNCTKLFIVKGRSDTQYCDRIIDDSGKSCRDVGAINTYNEKSKDNPIKQAYMKAYRRNNSRVRYKKMSKEDFAFWTGEARELRDKALDGKITLYEFETWLNK